MDALPNYLEMGFAIYQEGMQEDDGSKGDHP